MQISGAGAGSRYFCRRAKAQREHGKVVFGSVQSVARNLDAFQVNFRC